MHISCCYFHSYHETMSFARCMGFVGKLPLVFSLYEHSALRVCGGYGLLGRSSAPSGRGRFFLVFLFYGLLPQLFPLRIHFLPQLLCVYLCGIFHLLLLKLLLVGTGFDVGAVNKNAAGVYHTVIDCLVENMCKDFLGQFLRESLAEGIAHRGKMGNFVQQSIAQKPTVGQSILNPLLGLAQGWYPKQVLYQHHLDEHYRVCTRPTIVVAVIRIQPLIQPLIIHDLFDFPKQMLFRHQSFQVCYYRLSPGIFSPLFHEYTPISVLYQI